MRRSKVQRLYYITLFTQAKKKKKLSHKTYYIDFFDSTKLTSFYIPTRLTSQPPTLVRSKSLIMLQEELHSAAELDSSDRSKNQTKVVPSGVYWHGNMMEKDC